ncbi:speckle-type POZ protein-like B isoform X1 [Parasteatoda tepidariorum]|uniref:speckle-type POZ protein-like B isoform X1 n=1 Tax=Parasteatoda tepidariorum TaxID=114398 RepID=UPI00077F9BA2|nr:speckle-type POZ protein-like B [Parasteatoda tepidariorum]
MSEPIKVEYSFTWKIENYSFCFDKPEETLKSPIFTANNLNGSKWFLTFRPYKEKGTHVIACYLNRCKEDLCSEEIRIYFAIALINGNGFSAVEQENSIATFHRGTMNGWDKFSDISGWASVDNRDSSWKKDVLTIRCKIMNHLNRPESVAVTEIGIDKYSFQWKLKLSDCVAASQKKNFSLSETSQYEISVSAPSDLIDIKVEAAAEYLSSQQFLRGKIILLNQEDVEVISKNDKHLFNLEDDNAIWNFPSFISKEKLSSYLKNDIFSLLCEFSVVNGKESSEISSSAISFQINCNNVLTLSEDLLNLFTSSKHSDVELRSGSATFSVHKSLLAIRSPVFSAMFDQDMIEKHSGVVDISDIDPETLKTFLTFIYTGAVDIEDSDNALKLMMVAEKYQMPSLKEACSFFLMSAISPRNLCDILDLAEMLNLKQLKKCALDYFAKHTKKIMVLPQWKAFSKKNPELSMETFSYVVENFEIPSKKN